VLFLVRHASAGDRRAWRGNDSARPLDPVGHAQAEAIAAALASAAIQRALSSPSVRCVQTIEPLAAQLGLEIDISPELGEGAGGWRTEALVERLCGEEGDSVLCSHGDVIPEVLWRLSNRGIDVNPTRCKKASIWELHVADGTVSHGVYRPPRSFGAGPGTGAG
jgi:8-oxo-dGTP diphosphatase